MKILLGLIATLSVALVPALAETAKERAHEKVVAEAPPTDSSEQLAAQQIDTSYSSLKDAVAGMHKSAKKGRRHAQSCTGRNDQVAQVGRPQRVRALQAAGH